LQKRRDQRGASIDPERGESREIRRKKVSRRSARKPKKRSLKWGSGKVNKGKRPGLQKQKECGTSMSSSGEIMQGLLRGPAEDKVRGEAKKKKKKKKR